MKLFCGGIGTESNSFAVMRTGREDFVLLKDIVGDHTGGNLGNLYPSRVWSDRTSARGDQLVSGLMAWASPSGITQRSAYERLRDEMLGDLEAALPVDIILLNLHGAMIAEGYLDCEADLIARARERAGDNAVIGVLLDLHANIDETTIAAADIVVAYKHYPHTDIAERAAEVFDLSVAAAERRVKPVIALVDCRMAGQFPTSRDPLRGFVEAMSAAESRPGVLSISLVHGFRCGDVPNMGARMLVIADDDVALAGSVALEFAERLHGIRDRISFASISLPLERAMSDAVASPRRPVVVADQADNPGSGGPGDSTFALQWLIDRGVANAAIGILYDPEVVRIARKAGVGATLAIRLGGKLGVASGSPIDLDMTVAAVIDDYRLAFPQEDAEDLSYPAGNVVALHGAGIDVVVGDKQIQCYAPTVFSDLQIDPGARDILVVKSAQHFYGAFEQLAGEIIYMTSAGAVPPDPRSIRYRNFDPTNVYPWADTIFTAQANARP